MTANGEPGLPATENKVFYPAVDGLRALSVLLVFLTHYRLNPTGRLTWGWVGVDFFFVLSGFLITGILYDTRNASNRFRAFYMRRTLRIFPLYYLVWVAALLVTPILHLQWERHFLLWPFYLGNYSHLVTGSNRHLDAIDWVWTGNHRTFFSVGHLWSLCVEEQFYFVWPLVVYYVRDLRRLLAICVGTVLLMPLLRFLALVGLPADWIHGEILYRASFFRCDSLLLGGACALYLRKPRGEKLLDNRLLLGVAVVALSLCYASETFITTSPGLRHLPVAPWVCTYGYTLIDTASACLMLYALQAKTLLYRFLTFWPLAALGRVSYGFYVYHDIFHPTYGLLAAWLVGYSHHSHRRDALATEILALICTIILAFASYRFFEAPFLRLKRFFSAVEAKP